MIHYVPLSLIFFFNDTATTEIYTLSLHDALPISRPVGRAAHLRQDATGPVLRPGLRRRAGPAVADGNVRSEEHTSELQSRLHLVCRLLLEKKKKQEDARGTRRPIAFEHVRAPRAC